MESHRMSRKFELYVYKYYLGNLDNLPYKSESFDAVFSYSPLMCLYMSNIFVYANKSEFLEFL